MIFKDLESKISVIKSLPCINDPDYIGDIFYACLKATELAYEALEEHYSELVEERDDLLSQLEGYDD